MFKKIIYLEAIDPVSIYGTNNANLDVLKRYFPKIRIVARGNEIKAFGSEADIAVFEEKVNLLIDHYNRYNNLTETDIENLIFDDRYSKKELAEIHDNIIVYGNNGVAIRAKTFHQKMLVEQHNTNDLLFAVGPAGTGKTYIAVALAVRALRNKEVKRIILSRPAVEAEERLGFLPGDLKDKLDPYLQPLYDALNEMIPPRRLQEMISDGIIQIAPLAFMRGRTLSNAFVILDEAQNATVNQVKMFLTRMGENSKFIVTGDLTQIDLPRKENSGLSHCNRILANLEGISFIYFDKQDVLRHKLVKQIIEAYDHEIQHIKPAYNKKTNENEQN